MLTYEYAVFLRCPKTGEVQHGTVQFDSDGYMDCHSLFERLVSEKIKKDLNSGYTLIGFNVVNVFDSVGE
jgi:hypothetical protein